MPDGQEQQYLDALKRYLERQVRKGLMTVDQANEQGNYAVQQLNTGAFGSSLPYYSEIYAPRQWYRSDPRWRLGTQAGAQMAMPPDLRYYTGLGLSPSEALSWTKYQQSLTGNQQPGWTVGYGGQQYTPDQWQLVGRDLWQQQQQESQQGMKAQLEYQEAMRQYEATQQWQQNLRETQAALARGAPGRDQAAREEIRREFEAQFERARAGMISGLGGAGDWIKRWEAERWENPFKAPAPEGGPGTFAQEFGGEYGMSPSAAAQTGLRYAQDPQSSEFANLTPEQMGQLAWVGMEVGGGAPPPARPTTPPAPSWLPAFVPSQVAGQPITKAPVATPSGQLWSATPPSVLAGLGGYTEWAGARPLEDIYAHMLSMQPQTPIGAGRTAWRPQRQWA